MSQPLAQPSRVSSGRARTEAFVPHKLDDRLIKERWTLNDNCIAMRFAYE